MRPVWDSAPLVPLSDEPKQSSAPIQLVTFADDLRSDAFKKPRRTFSTGIEQFDRLASGGLKATQQSIWMAPTGVGKTGLCGTFANLFVDRGYSVLWVLGELPPVEQATRLVASRWRRDRGSIYTADDLLSHRVHPSDVEAALDGLPLYRLRVRRRDGNPFFQIREYVTAIAEKHGVAPLIVGDYVQKFAAAEDADNRRISVAAVSDEFLSIAEDFDTHTLLISSVARSHYNAMARKARKQAEDEDPRDWLAAAKEAGELEYDAANVNFLDVADEANALGERNARIIVAKCRSGSHGYVGMKFHGPSGLFFEAAESADVMKPQKRDVPDLDGRVLEYIRQRPGQAARAVRTAIDGVGVCKVDGAIERLISAGKIERVAEDYQNSRSQTRKRDVLYPIVQGAK